MSQPQTTGHASFRDFPLNAWYAAAWDHEVGRNLLAKTVAGRPIVFYRTTAGRAVALADACWHRLAPLSMGKLRGDDEIMCGYHGICYDADGRATFMPAQDTINPSATVHSYPVVERHRYVWVWPGDPALADPDTVPDLYWNDDPDWAGDGKTIHVNCSYQLIVDNLMDLTHEQFVHGSSIGHDSLSESDFEVTHSGQTVTVTKWMLGIDPPPFWKRNLQDRFPDYEGLVDRWQIIKYTAPSTIAIDVGVAKAGHRRARGRPQPGRHRHRDQHDDPRDRQHLLLPVGVRPRLVPGQAGDHHPAARGRVERLLRGRGDAGGPAAGDRGQPRLRLLQPQHRRRQHVDPPQGGRHDRRRVRARTPAATTSTPARPRPR